MGKYLDMLQRVDVERVREISEKSEISQTRACGQPSECNRQSTFFRLNRLFRTFQELERRCPDYVDPPAWQSAVESGRSFLAKWGEQAEALGWTARDVFGLHKPPEKPNPSYRRLSRYDETGLIWSLQGREVIALTEDTAAIRLSGGSVTVYRRYRRYAKPAYGPVGDSLDDFR